MSGKLVGEVYEKKVAGMAQRVLLAMADHAHDDGSHCFPSITRLAWKIGCNEKTIRRTIEDLESQGVLQVDRQTGRVNEYRIVLAQLADKDPFFGVQGRPNKPRTFSNPDEINPGHLEQQTPDISGKTPDILSLTPDTQMSDEPLTVNLEPSVVNRHAARASRRGSLTAIPDDFKATDDLYDWALEKGLTATVVDLETERFVNHALSIDRRVVRWEQALKNWLLKSAEDIKQGRGPGYRAGSGTNGSRAEDPDRRNWTSEQWFED